MFWRTRTAVAIFVLSSLLIEHYHCIFSLRKVLDRLASGQDLHSSGIRRQHKNQFLTRRRPRVPVVIARSSRYQFSGAPEVRVAACQRLKTITENFKTSALKEAAVSAACKGGLLTRGSSYSDLILNLNWSGPPSGGGRKEVQLYLCKKFKKCNYEPTRRQKTAQIGFSHQYHICSFPN